MSISSLYSGERGAEYYAQREGLRSESAQRERAELFTDLESAHATIVDFGCGNGALLEQLYSARKIGIEISPYARADAERRLDVVVGCPDDIESEVADLVISYHALEHVESPADVLRQLWRVLKPEGLIRIVVPCETPLLKKDRSWRPEDINMHLFTWSPLTLGNLLSACGYEVLSGTLAPNSGGGRVGRMLPAGSRLRAWARWRTAISNGRFHTVVTARKRGHVASASS